MRTQVSSAQNTVPTCHMIPTGSLQFGRHSIEACAFGKSCLASLLDTLLAEEDPWLWLLWRCLQQLIPPLSHLQVNKLDNLIAVGCPLLLLAIMAHSAI